MIIDILKYLIVGTKQDLDQFFELSQEKGFLEFLSIEKGSGEVFSQPIQDLLKALKILREHSIQEYSIKNTFPSSLSSLEVAQHIIQLTRDLEKLRAKQLSLEKEILRVSPFGDFSTQEIENLEQLGNFVIQFFCVKSKKSHKIPYPSDVFYICTEYNFDYFMSISSTPILFSGMIEVKITESAEELREKLLLIHESIHQIEHQLKEHLTYINFLRETLKEELNQYYLHASKNKVVYPLDNGLFIVTAWIPQNKVAALNTLIEKMNIHVEPIATDKEERVPTHLENKGLDLVGEELIKVYDIPSTYDKDPSRWVLWFFALFFGIIVGDAGYGVLFLGAASFLKWKFSRQLHQEQKNLLKLFFILSYSSIVWGAATFSYFGIHLSPHHPLVKASPLYYLIEKKWDYHLSNKDDLYKLYINKYPKMAQGKASSEMLDLAIVQKKGITSYPVLEDFTNSIMLELTLVIGIIHLTVAFLRHLHRNMAGIGWIFFMWGGYLFFPNLLNATSIAEFLGWVDKETAIPLGLQCLYGGTGLALVIALIQHRFKGLNEITHIIQIFSDILSYLRLYALNLAGAIIASTFNQEGVAFGLFFGFVIILLGHLLNIFLGFMGGVIHGLRLNFLEWYHYCFEGGGRLFNPLKKIKHLKNR